MTAPVTVGRDFLAKPIAEFQRRHPEMRVAMLLTNDLIDLVADGIDLAALAEELRASLAVAPREPAKTVRCRS
jgi:LysR family transcriptional regulator, regulator for bpeEF and oprC